MENCNAVFLSLFFSKRPVACQDLLFLWEARRTRAERRTCCASGTKSSCLSGKGGQARLLFVTKERKRKGRCFAALRMTSTLAFATRQESKSRCFAPAALSMTSALAAVKRGIEEGKG